MSRGIPSFTLTHEHLTLARRLYVEWHSFRDEPDHYGVPAINAKRPYGNSHIPGDVIDELGWDCPDPDDEGHDETEYAWVIAKAWRIHREMEVVMEILLQHAGTIALPGVYDNLAVAEWASPVWRRADEQPTDLAHLSPAMRSDLIAAVARDDLAETTVACERERLRQGEAGIEARLTGRDPVDVALLSELLDAAKDRANTRRGQVKGRLTTLERRLEIRVEADRGIQRLPVGGKP